jgi:predicted PhzF superfamily epimerase YddE/YHI9
VKLRQYQVDAFTAELFAGNPAAVVPLETWLGEETLQAIALENNLSETAFFVPNGQGFDLRWFTPEAEVELCGHATLASAFVLFERLAYPEPEIRFETRSGPLSVRRRDEWLEMDFPASLPQPCDPPRELLTGLGREPREVLAAADYVAVFGSEREVRELEPDFGLLGRLGLRGVCVTAPGDDVDFVSRFFAPHFGIPEDPVTGSAHCQLTPYWAARLGRNRLEARQLSRRGGEVLCELRGDRVLLSGRAVLFLEGSIETGP